MKVYKVFDDEWEQIMNRKQICKFAISQVYNCPEYFLKDNIRQSLNPDYISKIVVGLLRDEKKITFNQAKQLLTVRDFEIEELN